MGWLIFLAYVVGGLISARKFYVMGFEADCRDTEENYPHWSEKRKLKSAQSEGYAHSIGGLIWPIVWVVLGVMNIISRPTPTELRIAEEKKREEFNRKVEAEMVRLRNWMQSEKLGVSDPETLRTMAVRNLREATDK